MRDEAQRVVGELADINRRIDDVTNALLGR